MVGLQSEFVNCDGVEAAKRNRWWCVGMYDEALANSVRVNSVGALVESVNSFFHTPCYTALTLAKFCLASSASRDGLFVALCPLRAAARMTASFWKSSNLLSSSVSMLKYCDKLKGSRLC